MQFDTIIVQLADENESIYFLDHDGAGDLNFEMA